MDICFIGPLSSYDLYLICGLSVNPNCVVSENTTPPFYLPKKAKEGLFRFPPMSPALIL
jgi:hypothetical protein